MQDSTRLSDSAEAPSISTANRDRALADYDGLIAKLERLEFRTRLWREQVAAHPQDAVHGRAFLPVLGAMDELLEAELKAQEEAR